MSTSATSTTHATSNPAITSKDVIEFREANLGFSGCVSSRYKDQAGVGTTIRWSLQTVPNSGVARSKAEGNATSIVHDVNTEGSVTLTINQWMYSSYEVEEFEAEMTVIDLKKWLSRGAAYVLDVSIDDTLAALIDDFNTSPQGTLAFPLTDTDIRAGIQALDDANAPGEGRYFGMSPATKNTLMGIERYVSSDFNRGSGGNIIRGTLGDLYGLSLWQSTNIEGSNAAGHDNGIWQRDAIAMGMRMKPSVREFDNIAHLSREHAISAIWGVIETRDDHGVFMRGE